MGMVQMIRILIGMLVGIIIGVLIVRWARGSWKRVKSDCDERQKIARGVAYRNAFWAMTLYLGLWFMLDAFNVPLLSQKKMIMFCFFGGLLVFAISCIMKDAYLGIHDKASRWVVLDGALMLMNLVLAGIGYRSNSNTAWVNLSLGIVMLIILIAMGIRAVICRTEEQEEE